MKKFLKRLFSFIGGLVVVAGLAVGGYFIYKNYIEKNFGEFEITYKYGQLIEGYGDKLVIVKGYKGKSPETIIIPETYNTNEGVKPVRAIDSNAFKGNTIVKTFETPESLMTFGLNAFDGCTSLETFTIKALYINGFAATLGSLDASKITFNVVNSDVSTSILTAYPTAHVVIAE